VPNRILPGLSPRTEELDSLSAFRCSIARMAVSSSPLRPMVCEMLGRLRATSKVHQLKWIQAPSEGVRSWSTMKRR